MPTLVPRLFAAATLTLTLALAGCGDPAATPSPTASASAEATPTPTPTPSVSVPVVNTLDGIHVTGAAGAAPEVKVPSPMAISETQSKVLVSGTGPVVSGTALVDVQYVGVNGRTGEKFDSSWDRGASAVFPLEGVVPGFKKGIEGKKVGDRVLVAMTGADGYDQGGGNPQAGIEVGDTLVFVVDVVEASVATATGTAAAPPPGAPSVTVTDDKPEVTIPAGADVPSATAVHPLVTGSGRAVGPTDTVLVRYRSWSWKTGKLLEDRWATPVSGAIDKTIPAWTSGIVGRPLGSRVMIVASPADSYPEGANNPQLEKGDTPVYVVDILFTAAQPWQ